jgi:hypothetical protein
VGKLKGQLTIYNLFALFITLVMYVALLSAINPLINSAVATLQATPNEFTPISVGMLYMITFFLFFQIVATGFRYVSQPGGGGY